LNEEIQYFGYLNSTNSTAIWMSAL
jgi:hypothetical protein